ncbi:MAG: hypothetical protein WAV90_05705 [Gordonia amarae]
MSPHTCRFDEKRKFLTHNDAVAGARRIRDGIERTGGHCVALNAYRCPDADHWHLTHYRQGQARCRFCGSETSAWHNGRVWMLGDHRRRGERCPGSGTQA